ncbi:MAG: SDR family NAD(P)-dependent oxidoreductase [Clostridia bacterium]|nr:SDR family NAD(P)-dependent oxidoreductase [Clostridia bacterium]
MKSAENILFNLVAEQKISSSDAAELFKELENKNIEDDIAIIGMSCRLPKAKNIDEYWENLRKGICCIDSFPKSRWEDALNSSKCAPLKDEEPFLKGGYLNDVDKFDPGFFRISPQAARWIEPSHRLFLLTAWEAFEDAGYTDQKINGTNTGVYVGTDHTYRSNYGENTKERDFVSRTGSWTSILAGRVAYALNLRGPNVVVDTACSGGLVAVNLACSALKRKECEMAIAGGVNFIMAPYKSNGLDMVQSNDNVLRTFDKNANGTIWGEGVCSLLLKPLKKAIEDNDNIHAVIKGSAFNNDGASGTITAPNAEAQEEVIIKAWQDAKVAPETITYIEAHGTGTNLGDPIEVKGLTRAFKRFTDRRQFCGVGSVKTSIGHAVAASGLASMIKVIMAMKHGEIPASLNFKEPNPFINFSDSPLFVNDKLKKWETYGNIKRAGISAFGFSGTNGHVVMEEAPEIEKNTEEIIKKPYIFSLSAKNEDSLRKYVKDYIKFLDRHPELKYEDICYTAATGRGHYNCRLSMVLNSREELIEKLTVIDVKGFSGLQDKGICYGAIKIVKGSPEKRETDEITEIEIQQITEDGDEKVKAVGTASPESYGEILQEICRLYTLGADIKWDNIFKGQNRKKVSLPGYPMKMARYWVEEVNPKREGAEIHKAVYMETGHPLLGHCVSDNIFSIVYENCLSPETHWVLADHKIIQRNMLPGTAYIEIAMEACQKYFNCSSIELKDILFLQPFALNFDESREIQTIIKKEDGYVEFVVCSKQEDIWIRHAEGKAYETKGKEVEKLNINDIMSRCSVKTERAGVKEKIDAAEFGSRWNTVSEVFSGNGEMLVAIELPGEHSADLKEYGIHPAMLDNAVNISIRLNDSKNYYLPFSYGSMKIHGKMPGKFFSYIKNNGQISEGKEFISFDILLVDTDGNVFTEINNYSIKRVHEREFRFRQSEFYYETIWVPKELKIAEGADNAGCVVVFKGKGGIGSNIIDLMKAKGRSVIEVDFGTEFKKLEEDSYVVSDSEKSYSDLLAQVRDRKVTQVIHLLTVGKSDKIACLNELEGNLRSGINSLFYIIKGLVANRYNEFVDIVLVSDYANQVKKDEEIIHPHNSAFFGLGKVAVQEYGNLKCRCLDIDGQTGAIDIVNELAAENYEYIAAYRNRVRYIEEFRKLNVDIAPDNKLEVKEDGAYIITGGLGGIGLEIGKYLAAKNKANICLISRSSLCEREKWEEILMENIDKKLCSRINAVKSIEEAGSKVVCYSADITKEADVKAVLSDIKDKFGKINGIFHCAGIAGDGFIVRKNEDVFNGVIAPKIQGTWLLDKYTENDNVDILVLFSSIFTVMGGPGQGDYCAANSYLDSFTAYRNRKGRRTVTINWPGWKETGMAADHGLGETSGLFKSLTNTKAINALEEIINKNVERVIVGEFDFETINHIKYNLMINFSSDIKLLIERKTRRLITSQEPTDKNNINNVSVTGKNSNELTEIEIRIGQIWACVLGLKEINIYESYQDMGGDSLLATHIVKALDMEYPGIVKISDIFSFPTVAELSKHISGQINVTTTDTSEEYTEDGIDDKKLKDLLDSLESGESSEENILDLLSVWRD